MSQHPAKDTSWHVHSSKTLIRLHRCAGWSESSMSAFGSIGAVWSVFDWASIGSQGSNVFFRRKTKALIRLCKCADWFDSLLYAHATFVLLAGYWPQKRDHRNSSTTSIKHFLGHIILYKLPTECDYYFANFPTMISQKPYQSLSFINIHANLHPQWVVI